LILSVVAASVLWIVGTPFAAEQEGAVEPAEPEKPASIEAYERIVAEMNGGPTLQQDPARFAPFPADALDIIAEYRQLFADVENQLDTREMTRILDILARNLPEWTDGDKSQVTKFIAANRHLIQEIRRMADKGGPVYPLDFSKGYEMEMTHLAQMRSCARLLRASAFLKGMEGHYAAAVDDIITVMKLGDALAQEPILVPQLVRIAICLIANSTIQDSLDGADLSPELTDRLLTHLAEAGRRDAFADSFAGEMYFGLTVFAAQRAGEPTGIPKEFDFGPPKEADEQAYVKAMKQLRSAARLPYYKAAPGFGKMQQEIENVPEDVHYTRQIVTPFVSACIAQARHEATIDLARIGILLEQYKAKEGSYPLTLDPIAEHFGGTLPIDPFTGRGYIYRPSFDSFLLYSVGENLRDDGGTHDYKRGDIVWRGKNGR
jgi:hypothetical protein